MRNLKEKDDEFFDASLIFTDYKMTLQESINETCRGLQLFLNNRFALAKNLLKPYICESMYHSLGYSTLLYLQAFMTFDTTDLENANDSLRKSLEVCQKFRHKKSFSASWGIRKSDFNKYTIDEVHAELCYAECILEKALLTFIQDESLLSFVKGGMKIRTSYYGYKECQEILDTYQWHDGNNYQTKSHFESGTRMGIGGFNLIIANLPARILKLLEFIGFSGDKNYGIRELELGFFRDLYSLRSPLCGITLLVYHLFTTYMLGTGEGDIVLCQKILNQMLRYHPNGAIFLYFQARLYEVTGNMQSAIEEFTKSINCQHELKQIHHLCYWELMWCYAFGSQWAEAANNARTLSEGSKWSLSTYLYQRACFLMMVPDRSSAQDEEIVTLINDVPLFKQRLAGKSLPVEKFVIKKCQRFKDQNNRLIVPAFEILYIWNGFSIVRKRTDYLKVALERIDQEFEVLNEQKESDPFYDDNFCLIQLLRGVCLKCLGDGEKATSCFYDILDKKQLIKDDLYLVPYAIVELAFIAIQLNDTLTASQLLENARTYNGYSLQSRLHFKIHSAFKMIEAISNPPTPTSLDSTVLETIQAIPSYPLLPLESITSSESTIVSKSEPKFFNSIVSSSNLPNCSNVEEIDENTSGSKWNNPPQSPLPFGREMDRGNSHHAKEKISGVNALKKIVVAAACTTVGRNKKNKTNRGPFFTKPPVFKISREPLKSSHSSHDLGAVATLEEEGGKEGSGGQTLGRTKKSHGFANTSISFLNLAAAYLPRTSSIGGGPQASSPTPSASITPSPSPSSLVGSKSTAFKYLVGGGATVRPESHQGVEVVKKKSHHHHHHAGANLKSLANSTALKLRHHLSTMLPQNQSSVSTKNITPDTLTRPD